MYNKHDAIILCIELIAQIFWVCEFFKNYMYVATYLFIIAKVY